MRKLSWLFALIIALLFVVTGIVEYFDLTVTGYLVNQKNVLQGDASIWDSKPQINNASPGASGHKHRMK